MPAPPSPTPSTADRNWAGQAFLALLPGSVGCLLCGLILDPHAAAGRFTIAYTTVALVMAVLGVLAPVLRIRKPLRAYRMLQGIGRSPLSRQAALVASFLALVVVSWALTLASVAVLWLDVLAVVVGFVAVVASGLTYGLLGSQPRWRHWSGLVGLLSTLPALGVTLGLVVALGWRDALLGRSAAQIAAVIVVLVGVCGLLAASLVWRRRMVSLALLSVALVATALSLLTPWLTIVAAAALFAALVAWRTSLFLAASVNGWRREVLWLRPQIDEKEA